MYIVLYYIKTYNNISLQYRHNDCNCYFLVYQGSQIGFVLSQSNPDHPSILIQLHNYRPHSYKMSSTQDVCMLHGLPENQNNPYTLFPIHCCNRLPLVLHYVHHKLKDGYHLVHNHHQLQKIIFIFVQ